MTDYGLTVSGEEDKTVSGRIGSGTARITLSTDNGDLHIKRGQAFLPEPAAPKLRLRRGAGAAQCAPPEDAEGFAAAAGNAVDAKRLEHEA